MVYELNMAVKSGRCLYGILVIAGLIALLLVLY
jgi:hypothetical protein